MTQQSLIVLNMPNPIKKYTFIPGHAWFEWHVIGLITGLTLFLHRQNISEKKIEPSW